jgi:hypothetical protein
MVSKTVTFLRYEQLPKAGDYLEVVFDFSVVDSSLVSPPEEIIHTSQARIAVKMSRTLQSTWRLESPQLEKVLFEHANRHLLQRVSDGAFKESDRVDLNTSTAPAACPYDPDRIVMTPGTTFEVEVERHLGFRTK